MRLYCVFPNRTHCSLPWIASFGRGHHGPSWPWGPWGNRLIFNDKSPSLGLQWPAKPDMCQGSSSLVLECQQFIILFFFMMLGWLCLSRLFI